MEDIRGANPRPENFFSSFVCKIAELFRLYKREGYFSLGYKVVEPSGKVTILQVEDHDGLRENVDKI